MEIITIDGMVEHDFRHSIEDMLRLDQVEEAIERLRLLLQTCAGLHEILPPCFLDVTFRDVEIVGWHRLANRLLDHDRPNHPISAMGVTLADARALGGPGPSRGRLVPFIKTFYFSDDAYAFSDATRNDLLDGYSREGFEWQGDYQATDATLSIKGLDNLYGAIIELEDRLLASKNPSEEEIRAGTIGACFVAALIHQALRQTIREKGLPRPLCVFAACDGVYPFFDAPVAGRDECTVEKPAEPGLGGEPAALDDGALEDDEERADDLTCEDSPAEASLLTLISRKGLKAPVIVLGEEDAQESARYSEMAGAQRLGVDEGFVPECGDFAEMGDNAAMADSLVRDDPQWHDYSPDVHEPMASSNDPRSSFPAKIDLLDDAPVGFSGYPVLDEVDHAAVGLRDPSADPGTSGDFFATKPDFADLPFIPSATHSLRAKIRLAQPDTSRTLRERIGVIVDRVSRLIFRR